MLGLLGRGAWSLNAGTRALMEPVGPSIVEATSTHLELFGCFIEPTDPVGRIQKNSTASMLENPIGIDEP